MAVDDFGTGYSSLYRVNEWPVSVLKIDRWLIQGISDSASQRDLCQGVIDFAHATDLRVVGEWVETEEQLAVLEKLDCDLVQGYYFSKPLNAGAFERWLDEWNS